MKIPMKPAIAWPGVKVWLFAVEVFEFREAAPMMVRIMKTPTPSTMVSMRKARNRFHQGASARWSTSSRRTFGFRE